MIRWVIYCILFVSVILTQAKSDVDAIEDLIRKEHYSELYSEIRQLSDRDQKHPSVLFAKGLVLKDSHTAAQYFTEIVQNHHNSKFADDALFRLAQYHYSLGSYNSARKYFSLLSRHFSSSKFKDESQYLYCQCLIAQGSLDSARVFLTAFVKNVKNSPYIDLSVLDLDDLSSFQANMKTNDLGTNVSRYKYSIQVGAFSDRKNAVKYTEMLNERKFVADIVPKQSGNRQLWAVWIGKFQTSEKAKDYAERYLKKIFDDYQIIELNQ